MSCVPTPAQVERLIETMPRVATASAYVGTLLRASDETVVALREIESLACHFSAALRDHMNGHPEQARERLLDYFNHMAAKLPVNPAGLGEQQP